MKKWLVKGRLPDTTTNIGFQAGLGSVAEAALSASGEQLDKRREKKMKISAHFFF